MGDVVNSMKRALRNGKAWTLVLAAASIWSGCAAASPDSVSLSSEPVPPAAAPASLPATISRLAVVEGAPGSRIELMADSALVWTTYRDADGALVVELPNTRPSAGVHAENPDRRSGFLRRGFCRRERRQATHAAHGRTRARRPSTRSSPSRTAFISTCCRPEPRESRSRSKRSRWFGPVRPVRSKRGRPRPRRPRLRSMLSRWVRRTARSWRRRRRDAWPLFLGSVDVLEDGPGTVVRIAGDGEFAYSTFQLANPDRFVIDLDGVVNQSARSSAPLEGEILARIRVSQFKKSPDAVARVVFDLRQTVPPSIERGPEGLVVRFSSAAQATLISESPAAMESAEESAEPATTAATLDEVRPNSEVVGPQRGRRIDAVRRRSFGRRPPLRSPTRRSRRVMCRLMPSRSPPPPSTSRFPFSGPRWHPTRCPRRPGRDGRLRRLPSLQGL